MARKREYEKVEARVFKDQAAALRTIARQNACSYSWVLRRVVAIGLQHFTMPASATASADSATDSERGHRAAQDEGANP